MMPQNNRARREPREIADALPEGVPVASEVVGKAKALIQLFE
jgi:hypothetical protein